MPAKPPHPAHFLHDLNNLLMAMQGYAVLLREDLDGTQQEYAARIVNAADAAKALVADYAAQWPSPVTGEPPPLRLLLIGRATAATDKLLTRLEQMGLQVAMASQGDAQVALRLAPRDWDVVAGLAADLAALTPDSGEGPLRVALEPGLTASGIEAAVRRAVAASAS